MYEPLKELGQNFLSDRSIVSNMVNALEVKAGEDVIEIGPGHGILTDVIAEKVRLLEGAKLYAVELDKRFYDKLHGMYVQDRNIEIVNANILDWIPTFETDRNIKIIGSLPYYITSPIIHQIVKMNKQPEIAVVLIQKEVADKISANAPDASYLSSFVQTFFTVETLFMVSKKKFNPEPQVDGGVLRLTKRDPPIAQDEAERYEGFLHKAFSHPRKMLNKPFTKEELEKGNIAPNLRPQNLTSDQWAAFYNILK